MQSWDLLAPSGRSRGMDNTADLHLNCGEPVKPVLRKVMNAINGIEMLNSSRGRGQESRLVPLWNGWP